MSCTLHGRYLFWYALKLVDFAYEFNMGDTQAVNLVTI
jgi:hypothetical protein